MTLTLKIKNESDLFSVATVLAWQLLAGDVIYLHGGLGAGKTTLTRGCVNALGHAGVVKSPTYSVVESYQLDNAIIHHFDLYRVRSEEELYALGIEDYFTLDTICLIEWPEQGHNVLPAADLRITLNIVSSHARELRFDSGSNRGKQLLSWLIDNEEMLLCHSDSGD